MMRGLLTGALASLAILGACPSASADEPQEVQPSTQALPPSVEKTHPRWSAVTTGASLAGAFYLLGAWGAATAEDERYRSLFIPVGGPFAVAFQEPSGMSRSVLVLDGAAQGVGVVVMILGFAFPERDVASDRAVVVPIVTPRGAGLAGRF